MTVYAYNRVCTLSQAEEGDSVETQVHQVLAYERVCLVCKS